MRVALAAAALASAVVVALPADAAPTELRVGFVVSLELQPGTTDVGSDTYTGFLRAAKLPGITGRVVRAGPPGPPWPAVQFLARRQYDLLIVPLWNPFEIAAFARKHPRLRFLIPDAPPAGVLRRPPNVRTTFFRSEQAAYLGGYLAALMEKRRPSPHIVSAVGGIPIPQVLALLAGFRAGAERADPTVRVVIGYSHNFGAPQLCRAVALKQIAGGSGVVFNVAGVCGLGALRAAEAKGVWSVGVDVDQSRVGRHVLTSVLKREDVSLEDALRAIRSGTFPRGGVMAFDLANGGVGLGTINPAVPRAFVRKLAHLRAEVAAGRIRVPRTLLASR